MFDQKPPPNKAPLHGGNLTAAAAEFNIPLAEWIDLSTGINPACYPATEVSPQRLRRLPTPGDIEQLLTAARAFYRVQSGSSISAAPGTQAVLQNLPLLYPNRTITILSPTYSEHRHTWEQAGNEVITASDFTQLGNTEIAVLVNPNNPDGRRTAPEDILNLARKVELLIIDEAFGDASPDLSVIPHIGPDLTGGNVLVLRSLGKFFGLAGLRLGFVIGAAEITRALTERLGPWAVSGPALEIGTRALSDLAWITAMKDTLKTQSERLNALLTAQALSIRGGTELFTLIETGHAPALYQALGKAGILVRRFEDQPNWLRIGLPGAEVEWQRLAAVLNAID